MNKQQEWNKARAKLKKIFEDKDIIRCEMCGSDFALSFHHRHKRVYYIKKPELLGSFNEVLLLCASCHHKLEGDKKLSDKAFNKLR